jgi:uncharacterized protein YkwD
MWSTIMPAVAALAMTVSAPAAAPCAGADAAPAQLDRQARSATVLCLLNDQRAASGLPPLGGDRRLAAAARAHSRDMVAHQYFAHDSRSGASFAVRIRRAGWMRGRRSWRVGENLAWGTGGLATPRAILAAWMKSPPHRRAVLDSGYRVVGIGVAIGAPVGGAADGATYTADFGS